jgi:hypothetical protein
MFVYIFRPRLGTAKRLSKNATSYTLFIHIKSTTPMGGCRYIKQEKREGMGGEEHGRPLRRTPTRLVRPCVCVCF